MSIMTLSTGAAAFATLFGSDTYAAKWLTLGITFIGVIQIVTQIDRNAAIHERWLSDWNSLLYELKVNPQPSTDDMKKWLERYYRIESECVGQMSALANDCFNRAASALGREDNNLYRLRWYHRWFIQILSFETSDFR
jgi:hypothetical protein